MEISIEQSKILKTIAILMMLFLHLFNTLDYQGLFHPLIYIGDKPLVYYLSLFGDACVPIFAFVSGYGLYINAVSDPERYRKKNGDRLLKLYINYWVVLVIFVAILGLSLRFPDYPGHWTKFLFNATGLVNNYNGAWWFFLIYVLLVLSSPLLFAWVRRSPGYVVLVVSTILYLVAFYFRIYRPAAWSNPLLQWLHTNAALYGCTLLPFIAGALSFKYKINTRVTNLFSRTRYPSFMASAGILLLIVFHGLVPNFIVAPITGLLFIFLFNQVPLPGALNRMLLWGAPHATNMWLIHMFFYLIYFRSFIYGFKYVPLIFMVLVVASVLSSFIINIVQNRLQKLIL